MSLYLFVDLSVKKPNFSNLFKAVLTFCVVISFELHLLTSEGSEVINCPDCKSNISPLCSHFLGAKLAIHKIVTKITLCSSVLFNHRGLSIKSLYSFNQPPPIFDK